MKLVKHLAVTALDQQRLEVVVTQTRVPVNTIQVLLQFSFLEEYRNYNLPSIGKRAGLNQGPADLQSAALPLSYVPN